MIFLFKKNCFCIIPSSWLHVKVAIWPFRRNQSRWRTLARFSGFPRPCDPSSLTFLLFHHLANPYFRAARKISKWFGFDEKWTDQLAYIPIPEFLPSSVLSRCIAVSPIGREGNSTWSCGNGTFKCICIGNTEIEIAVNHSRSPFLSFICLIKISVALRVTRRKLSTMMFSVHAEVTVTTMMLENFSFFWRLSYIDSRFFADSSYSGHRNLRTLTWRSKLEQKILKELLNYYFDIVAYFYP